jgi:hypothetical protein
VSSGRLSGPLSGKLSGPKQAPWYAGWTFSRASAALAWTREGLLRSVSSGQKAASDLGILLGPAATNLWDNSLDLSATTTKTNVTLTASDADPAGDTGWLISDGAATGVAHFMQPSTQSWTSGEWGTFHFLADARTGRYLQAAFSNVTHGNNAYVNYDTYTDTFTVTGSAVSGTGSIPVADGLWWVWFRAPATSTATAAPYIACIPASNSARGPSYDGEGKTRYIARPMVQKGQIPTPPGPTARVADSMTRAASLPAGDWTLEFTTTWLAEQAIAPAAGTVSPRLFTWSDGTLNNYIEIGVDYQNYLFTGIRVGGGTATFPSGLTETSTNTQGSPYLRYRSVKAALRYTGGNLALFINGRKIGEAAVTLPSGLTTQIVNGDAVNARNPCAYWQNVRVSQSALSDNALVTATSRPAYGTPVIDYDVPATSGPMASLMIPAAQQMGGRLFVAWMGMQVLTHASGEGPGSYIILGYMDPGDSVATQFAFIKPADKIVDGVHVPHMGVAPNGDLVVFFGQTGSGNVHDGYEGAWACRVTNPTADVPTVGTPVYLGLGEPHKPFTFNGGWYIPLEFWPTTIIPTKPGITPGKNICRIDPDTLALTIVGTLPTGTNVTYGEATVVEKLDGTALAFWRTTAGLQYAISAVGDMSSWGSATSFSAFTTANSRAVVKRTPAGNLALVFNKSANPTRSNMTVAISTNDGSTWPTGQSYTFDTGTNISYPDLTFGADNKLVTNYDRERYSTAGSGAREIKLATLVEADVIAGTASGSTTVSVIVDGSP